MSIKLFEGEEHASIYSQARPSYPKELVDKIVKSVNSFDLAIDVGCGNGQATALFTPFFKKIFGFDVSENQIKEAKKLNSNGNISFNLSLSETLPLENESVDLITVAAALHWFNIEKFFVECQRILKPGAVLAVFSYYYPKISHSVKFDAKVEEVFKFLRPYFAKQIELNEKGYKIIEFPFRQVERDIFFKNELKWKIEDLLKFIQTLSGYQTFHQTNPESNFIKTLKNDFLEILKEEEHEKNPEDVEVIVNFEVTLILCRK
jgi:ubiquinone/menaquinone biosynthesis C-methylase UbiE